MNRGDENPGTDSGRQVPSCELHSSDFASRSVLTRGAYDACFHPRMNNQFALLLSDLKVERFGETEMPRLMDKQDWKSVMSDVGAAENVWCENVVCDTRNASCSLPGAGRYRVIFVKLDDTGEIGRTDTPRRRKLRISPEVRALRGAVNLEDKRDYKEILADSLQDKYESLV